MLSLIKNVLEIELLIVKAIPLHKNSFKEALFQECRVARSNRRHHNMSQEKHHQTETTSPPFWPRRARCYWRSADNRDYVKQEACLRFSLPG